MRGTAIAESVKLRRFKRYPAYKESGVEWLGEIPVHWRVLALKRIGDLQSGAGFPDDEQGLMTEEIPFFKVGDMGVPGNERELRECQHTVSKATARRLGAFVFPPRTIVFAKVGAALLLNRRRLLTRPSCIDNNMMGFMPDECDLTWAMYWLSGLDMGELANPGAVPSVNEGQMRDTPAIVPTMTEQRAIAAFLDRETARIDALVAKKERLIELLQEKRTALITRAVTKGLDQNVPMKDSSVEWLGEIPAHWEGARMWRISRAISGGTPAKEERGYWDGGVPWVSPKDMKRRCIDSSEDTVTERAIAETGIKLIAPPVVLVVVRGMILAHTFPVAITTVPVTINQDMKALRFATVVDPVFFTWLFEGIGKRVLASIVEEAAHGTRAIRMDQWRSVTVPLPPLPEQRAIAAFADREGARIDALIAKVRDAIGFLKELRTALISAAVTGKIDVREEVA